MPSLYAHYRFGNQILPMLPADVRQPIQRCRRLFDMGLHGPDFFFYHSYLTQTPIVQLGTQIHDQTGKEFFTRCCSHLREAPSEEALAYLYGILAHYCLDSACHPFVYDQTDDGPISHASLETDFDRHLLTLDGYEKPYTYDNTTHLKLYRDDYATIAAFYPEVSPEDIRRCIHSMNLATKLLATPSTAFRGLVAGFLKLASEDVRGMLMHKDANPACTQMIGQLMYLYNQALENFPEYLDQLCSHMTYNAPLGDLFTASFNR